MATAVPAVYLAIPLVFSHRFDQARSPFLLLGLVSCLQSVSVPLGMFVFATRNTASALRINVVCVAVDASIAIGLVPVIGLWGAAIANAATQLLSLILLTVVAVRRIGINARAIGSACRPVTLGLGSTVVAVTLAQLRILPAGVEITLALVLGAAATVIGFHYLPTWRVAAADAALVEGSLPMWLRRPYVWTARTFAVIAAPATETPQL